MIQFPDGLARVGGLARVDPVVVHVQRLRKEVCRRLKIFHTYRTLYFCRVL